jgi:hypothetical protein
VSDIRKQKTVYVVGAGFSAAMGLPVQARILTTLLEKEYSYYGGKSSEKLIEELDKNIPEISAFLQRAFPEQEQTLEDIFTLLDQTIQANGHYRGLNLQTLQEIRNKWIRTIVTLFHSLSSGYINGNQNQCQRFIAALLDKRTSVNQEVDTVSIISLNWDSILEDAFFEVIRTIDCVGKADIDYCVYSAPIEDSPHIPSTKQKASGIFNLKLLKIHGSTTWLRCPNSNYIYTGIGASADPYELYVKERVSPFINDNFSKQDGTDTAPPLEPYIITPTFTKVFNQPQIQNTWHNAYVELREATDIIFIGYSLPDSDYHFRTLLRRSIRDSTKIQVVLHKSDESSTVFEPVLDEDDEPIGLEPVLKMAETQKRYIRFFGKEKLTGNMKFEGAEGYIDTLLPDEQYSQKLSELKDRLDSHKVYKDYKNS